MLREVTLASDILGNSRKIWLQEPEGQTPQVLCLFLDGEYYVERMEVPALLAELQAAKMLPPLAIAYLSHVNAAVRWPESFCNLAFARFIREEAAPFVAASSIGVNDSTPRIIGGLSLTGLSAVHAALVNPDFFAGVFSQSGSFWWQDMKLVGEVAAMPASRTKFRIVCGATETTPYVEHGKELIQRVSQLDSNLAMRDALVARGFSVDYAEFDGGHDLASWKADLPRSLAAIL